MRVRVHYPAGAGSIVLRTDADWERDLRPVSVDGTRHTFELPVSGPFTAFKPLWMDAGGAPHWAQGENELAFADAAQAREIFPYFRADTGCRVCTPETVAAADGRAYEVRVFVPPGYDENPLERFPVVYLQDGQNLFLPETAFNGQAWKVDDTLRVLAAMQRTRRVIAIGITPRDRMQDYTAPGYDDYGRWIVETLKPWVDARYRTRPAASDTAVMGSSLGGVVSLHLAWQWPAVFGNAGCLSSTFGYRDDLRARIARQPRRRLRLYLDSGWPRDNYEVTRAMRDLLIARGYSEGRELLYLAFPHASHDENAWAMRAHIPFQHFFAR
jgi:predicted alpha/beta superfamily hydrolase